MVRWVLKLLLCCCCIVVRVRIAHASAFDVTPVSVTLSDKTSSVLLTLTNRAPEPTRFHISVFAWEQKPTGEMVLNPTSDVLFFPALLTLRPNEARNVRLGVQVKPGPAEKNYRVLVQELPPAVTPENTGAVRVLTKMSIPLFLEPRSPAAKPVLTDLTLQSGTLAFNVKNAGNKHLRMRKLVVKALSAENVLFSRDLDAWYLLAGGTRSYTVELPAEVCKSQKTVQIELQSDEGAAHASLVNAHCAQ
jgi:fimbrial chaperone protein